MLETAVGHDVLDSEVVARVPATFRSQLDLLFVVDDTEDMVIVQEHLVSMWQRLRGHLDFAEGGFPDVRVGVISSDVGVGAASVPGCTSAGDDAALVPTATGARWLTIDPALPAGADLPFASLVRLGDQGCAVEQPLVALARALDGGVAVNDGFLRDDAALGVIIVGGDDDCSVVDPAFFGDDGSGDALGFRCFREGVRCDGDDVSTGPQHGCAPRASSRTLAPVDQQARLLNTLKRDPRALAVGAVVGDADRVAIVGGDGGAAFSVAPACTETKTDLQLYPAVRVSAFASAAGGSVTGMCRADVDHVGALPGLDLDEVLAAAGTAVGHDVRRALGHRCLEGRIVDTSPAEPGLQFACEVAAAVGPGDERPLPQCENPNHVFDVAGPCWAIKAGPAECGDFPSQLSVQVNWGGDEPMRQPLATEVVVRCLVEDDRVVD